MVRIIEKGTRQIEQCEDCGCKFSFDNEDLMHYKGEGIYEKGFKEGFKHFIACPQCNSLIRTPSHPFEKVLEDIESIYKREKADKEEKTNE